jgi:acyl carrier protein
MPAATNMTLSPEVMIDRVRKALRSRFGADINAIGDEESLAQALGDRFDSLAVLEAVSVVEAEFDIEIDFVADDVRYLFGTIARIAQFARDRLADQAVLGWRS